MNGYWLGFLLFLAVPLSLSIILEKMLDFIKYRTSEKTGEKT